MKNVGLILISIMFAFVIGLNTSIQGQTDGMQAMGSFYEREHREADRQAREQQQRDQNASRGTTDSARSRTGGIGSDHVEDKLARERYDRQQQRDQNATRGTTDSARSRTGGIGSDYVEDKLARERYDRQQQARTDFQQQWDLGEQLRRENERSGTISNSYRPQSGVSVSPQSSSRNNPTRNSWEGLYDVRPPSVREVYGNRNEVFLTSRPGPYGHGYTSLSYLGPNNPDQKYKDLFENGLMEISPLYVGVSGPPRIEVGSRFNLKVLGVINGPVEVVSTGKNLFTVRTLPGHPLQGTVTWGVFEDSNKEVWLFHEGQGVIGEPEYLQRGNYIAAERIWKDVGNRARHILANKAVERLTREREQAGNRIQRMGTYSDLVRDSNGKFSPAPGYKWINKDDPNDLRVELKPGLVEKGTDSLRPAGGHRWVNPQDPKDFRVELRPGLTKDGEGNLSPARGYRWVDPNNPKDFRVEVKPGLVTNRDGSMSPAIGYRWVNPSDPKDFRVESLFPRWDR